MRVNVRYGITPDALLVRTGAAVRSAARGWDGSKILRRMRSGRCSVLTIRHIVVAQDGKSRTATVTGTTADGQKVHHVLVYEKQ